MRPAQPEPVPEPDLEPEAEPAAVQQRPEDPELRPEGPRTDLHSLRAVDPALDALSAHIQLTVSRTASVLRVAEP